MANKGKILLLNLPEEILDNIVSYLSYDEISHLRLVCQKFNKCCSRLLNQGFLKVERYHSQCLRDIKAQLPRRESERRDHPLARHSDILTAIETRLSLLSMTFMKYVDMGLCCFIPGKVIDEIYLVLRNIQATATPPRSHEILQELRDISSMAMEHFDEHIVPLLKQRIGASRRTIALPSGNLSLTGSPLGNNTCIGSTLKQELKKIQSGLKQVTTTNTNYKKEQAELRKKMLEYERKLLEFNEIKKRLKELEKTSTDLKRTHVTTDQSDVKKKMREMEKKISDQNQLLRENSTRLAEQDGKISEMSRKLLEYDRHVAELLRSRDQCLGDEQVAGTSVAKNIKSKIEPNSDAATINNEDAETTDLHNINTEKEETKISSSKCSVSIEPAQSKTCSKGVKSSKAYKRNSSALSLERDTKRSKQRNKM